jgi:hypothetical protein
MPATLEETLLSVFRQSMQENLPAITLDGRTYPVKRTSRRRLRQIDCEFDGHPLRALEQNPDTKSRWAQQARAGKKVMQFMDDTGYLAVIVDAKIHLYANPKTKSSP